MDGFGSKIPKLSEPAAAVRASEARGHVQGNKVQ